MTLNLLPPEFPSLLASAVQYFWERRLQKGEGQEGSRGSVIGGGNLDGFLEIVKKVALHCGLSESSVIVNGKNSRVLPGYFRPNKNWDALVVHEKRLLAVFEFKSQVGSFGNNFNNRSEEAIGSALDLWEAFRHNAFDQSNFKLPFDVGSIPVEIKHDPRPPFVGYIMLLQDCEGSTRPKREDAGLFYRAFPEFKTASYAECYRILCERMVEQRLYNAAALVLSDSVDGRQSGQWRSISEPTNPHNLFAQFAGALAAAIIR